MRQQTLVRLTTALAIGLALFAIGSPASATQQSCSPTNVSIDSFTLAILCSADHNWHFSSGAETVETRRAWLGMANFAILSGKNLMLDISGMTFAAVQIER